MVTRTQDEIRILKLRRRASDILERVEIETAQALGATYDGVKNSVMAFLEAHPESTIEDMYSYLSMIIEDAAENAAGYMVDMGSRVIDTSLEVQAESAFSMGLTTVNELNASVQVWKNQYKLDLLTEGHQEWYSMLKGDVLHPGGALRTTLEAANVWGEDLNSAVDLLISRDPDFSRFPEHNIDPIARARMIVRTESTRFDNAVSVSLSESIGIEDFINVGVGDERQSDICQGATEQQPMTIDQWKASRWGPAPRHPNCRCALVGVGPEFTPSSAAKVKAEVLYDPDENDPSALPFGSN